MAKTSRESFQQMLRLTDDMRDRLRFAATENNRSLNAEIVDRLEASLTPAPDLAATVRQEVDRAIGEHFEKLYRILGVQNNGA